MEDSKNSIVTLNAAQRVLARLKSPLLYLASELPTRPPSHTSLVTKKISKEVEDLSGGRFSLANEQNFDGYDVDMMRCLKLRMVDHQCRQYSWLSLSQLRVLGPDRACCYCYEPQNFEQIGGKIEIQKFVLHRSHQKAYFGNRNIIGHINDVYEFICIRCRSMTYDTPFTWFLRDSPGTNGCPCCEQRLKNVKT